MTLRGEVVHTDCLFFKGDIPCTPHKQYGVHCDGCSYYTKRTGRILIIKLGATGDVIRTTVLLPAIRKAFPNHEIWWLTYTPDIVPSTVHKRLKYSLESLQTIQSMAFDVVINLDKDAHACALAAIVETKTLHGFTLRDGVPAPANELSEQKFLTGIFDDQNKANTISYPQEILEMCGFEFANQEYEVDPPSQPPFQMPQGKAVIGLNTGCGDRWIAREWPLHYWETLTSKLQQAGYGVVLLGGKEEHERNLELKSRTDAVYEGTFSLQQFSNIVSACDVVVTTVTMALHLAIAHRRQVVLMNNIFNKHEFELYGRGVLIEPPAECKCFFQHECTNTEYSCMDLLTPQTIFDAVGKVVNSQ